MSGSSLQRGQPGVLIGFDVGGTKIEAAALDADGRVLMRERAPTPRDDYQGSIRLIVDLTRRFEGALGANGSVGLGIPGSLSPKDGRVRNANSVWLNGRPLKADLEAALDRPVRIENDANCLAVSEAADGAGAGERVVFAVILGTGCGAGVAIDGRVLAGRQGVAGEFGHNPLPWAQGPEELPGEPCWCGRTGCLETYLSGPGLARLHARSTGVDTPADRIVAAARAGDGNARRSLDAYVDRLARGLASVANLFDPDVIVLGGGVSKVGEIYPGLTGRIASYVFSDVFDTPVRPAAHGDASGVRGAAWLWK